MEAEDPAAVAVFMVAVADSEAAVAHSEAMDSVVTEVCVTALSVADSAAAEAIAVDTTVAAAMATEVDTGVAGDLGLDTIRGMQAIMVMCRMPVITAIRVIRTPIMDVRFIRTRTIHMAMHRAGTRRFPTTRLEVSVLHLPGTSFVFSPEALTRSSNAVPVRSFRSPFVDSSTIWPSGWVWPASLSTASKP